jgi:hypothetical protein
MGRVINGVGFISTKETEICSGCFRGNTELKSVSIPLTIESIGIGAFTDCSSLEKIFIPKSVKSIKDEFIDYEENGHYECMFSGCSSLKNIEVSEDNTEYSSIDGVLFNKDKSVLIRFPEGKKLHEYIVPLSVKYICSGAFKDCSSIELLILHDGIEEIGDIDYYGGIDYDNAFIGCTSLKSIEVSAENKYFSSIDGVLFNKDVTTLIRFPAGKEISSYIIPSSVEQIDTDAFGCCKSLREIAIPNRVEFIDRGTFYSCTSLEKVIIPNGVAEIRYRAFENCTSLKTVVIPSSVDDIHWLAFLNCTSLERIEISPYNEKYTFKYGVLLKKDESEVITYTKKLFVPSNIENIKNSIFSSCFYYTNLVEIEVSPDNKVYKSIDGILYEKRDCYNYDLVMCPDEKRGKVIIPDGVVRIENEAFKNCKYLEKIEIPSTLEYIGNDAFSGCTSLTDIVIPEGVTHIYEGAFQSCISLKEIIIPSTVQHIGDLFKNEYAKDKSCNSLISIDVHEDNQFYSSLDGVLYNKDKSKLIKCPEGKNVESFEIPKTVTTIGKSAFENCRFKYIDIPNNVKEIEYRTFYGCAYLEYIDIPNSVEEIGRNAFSKCISLKSVDIPYTEIRIGREVFSDCTSLTSIILPEGQTSTSYGLFEGCVSLKNVILPSTFKQIYDKAFKGCLSLTGLEIPYSVKQIGYSAFEDCCSLEKVNIPMGVSNIWSNTFSGCCALKEIVIPSSVERIENEAFSGCSSLLELDIPNSVTTIGEKAFANCTTLESIDLPPSVSKIGNYAFIDCSSLRNIYLSDNIKKIGGGLFENCSSLTDVYLGINIKSIEPTVVSIEYDPFTQEEIDRTYSEIYIFKGCKSLQNIDVSISNAHLSSIDGVLFNKDKTILIKYPEDRNTMRYTIPNSVKMIGKKAFSNCKYLESVYLSENIDEVGEYAFSECISLKDIFIHSNVSKIETGAFWGCKLLSNIKLPASITKIASCLFSECTSLKNVNIPNSIKEIGWNAFANCKSLKKIEIPLSVEKIGSKVFSGCSCLHEFEIPNLITEIDSRLFSDCISLESINIPRNVKKINDGIFDGCFGLKEIHINIEGIEYCEINEEAFEGINYDYCKLYIPLGTRWNYRNHKIFSKFKNIEIDSQFYKEQRQREEEDRLRKEKEEAERKRLEQEELERKQREEAERRKKQEEYEREQRRLRDEKARKEQEERNMFYRVTHDLKPDRVQVKEYLESKYVRHFYHFTDRRNLASIKRYGGLYSWSYCESHNITIPYAGGGSTSRSLDSFYGLEDYVRLSFCSNHPMMYRLEQEGYDLVLLKISVDVALLEETLFSDMNATDNNHQCGSTLDDLKKVNFVAVRETYLKSTHKYFKYHQAEVLVKTFIPIEKILNINEFI